MTAPTPAVPRDHDGAPRVTVVDDGAVRTLTLNRPGRLNAVDDAMLLELGRAVRHAEEADTVRAVVVTGAGRGFCSGADLRAGWGEDSALFGLRRRLNPVVLALTGMDKPVVVAVNGVCAGAGLAFAGAGDTRLCSADARFVPATVTLGIAPDGGMTWFLPRLIGPGRSFRWLCSGEHLDAATALDWGLVDEVVPPDELLPRAVELAAAFASAPGAAVPLTKQLLRMSPGHSLAEQLEWEHRVQREAQRVLAASTPDGAARPFATTVADVPEA